MTPDEARALLDGTTPGPWLSDLDRNSDEPSGIYAAVAQGGGFSARLVAEEIGEEADTALIAAAPTLAAMIAGMREEWGVHVTGYPKNIADWAEICDGPADSIEWFADEESAEEFATEREDEGFDTRVVRRYVTEPEEA